MVSFLTDMGKTYVERLINGGIAESRYICCFTSIAKDFEQEKDRLEAERKTLGQRTKVASGRDKDIQVNARLWEEEVDKIIQEETKTKHKCFFGFCPDCIWRYKRGKELANKMEEIKRLMEKGEKLENIELPRRLPDVERYSSQDYISFKSRESKYTELLDALKDESDFIIGLQGMGGTGKTTLAKKVGIELKRSEQFTHVIDTTVSYTPDKKKIQDDIAGPLGLKLEDCNESDRPKKLWSRLTNGEKILVILDDVWDRDRDPNLPLDFDAVGIPKRDNHKGCRVLITTRSKRVLNKMDCDKIIELELLSEEDAWIMFKRYAGISNNSSKSLIEKGRKIANECKRLPVAIAVIASSLKGQQNRGHEWDATLKSLKKHVSMHGVDDDLVGIYRCLKFSYDYMKDEKAKGLFLLCSVFREDEEIPIEILTRLGIGAGLFGDDYGSYDDARNQVVVAKNKLLDSCLLLEVHEEWVKMHDLVREAAQWMANKEIRAVNLSHKDQKLFVEREKDTKYLLCEGKVREMFSSRFGGSRLEILIAFFNVDEDCDCVEVPNSFFENIAGLRALHLNNKRCYSGKLALSLPQSIQSLTNLRSLLVDRVDLGDISILGNLQSVEALDLVQCKINELPHEITKLEKLRLLKLKCCEIRRNNPFEVIRRCSSLEELYFKDSFNSFCQEITFPKLQRYHVCRYLEWAIMNKSLSKCVAFDGYGNAGFFSEATFKDCTQTTEILRLIGIKGEWRNLIPEIVPIDQGMNDLVELGLHGISQLQRLIDTIDSNVRNVLSKLVVLELRDMENLEELCNGPLSFDSLKSLENLKIGNCQHLRSLFKCNLNLCNLKTMRLWKCPTLVSLFQLSTTRSLAQLEELHITDCERLENIIIDERKEEESREEIVDGGNDNKSRGSMFPKLKVLGIYLCPRLEFIFLFPSAQDLPVLQTIKIKTCDKLKCIFGQYVQLGSLKHMHLYELPTFKDIFPECYQPMSSCMKGSSSTYRDGSMGPTQLDPIICEKKPWTHICCYGKKYTRKLRSTTCTKLPFVSEDQPHDCSIALEFNSYCLHIWERAQCLSRQSQILCNIKVIKLSHISKIKSVFILSIAPKMLLETLTIRKCDELKHIIVDTADDNGGNNWGNVFPKLRQISIKDCMQLEYIFGHYADDHQNHNEIHLHLPTLECLSLCNLPSLIAMCPKKYRTTFPPLTKLELIECTQGSIKSIGDFIVRSVSSSLDNTTIKELSGNVEHFLALEWLKVHNSKIEKIFFFNEINGQQMNLGLQNIELHDLPVMTYLFMGPKKSFALQNLKKINIVRCEALEIMFSTSIVRCLPQLLNLIIEECKELKHIVEDDVENKKMSNSISQGTCFPKLQALVVINCNKLKCVLPASLCKTLPELKVVIIKEAEELEEIFGSNFYQKVEIPKLKTVAFVNLPSLCQAQEIQFQAVENRFVKNCQKLSLTSTPTQISIYKICGYDTDYDLREDLRSLFEQLREEYETEDTGNENQSEETTKDFAAGIEVQASSEHELTSSQIKTKLTLEEEHEFVENVPGLEIESIATLPTNSEERLNELQSTGQQCQMNQQHPLGETDNTVKPSQYLKETEDQIIQEGSLSEKTVTTNLSTDPDLETRNELTIPLVAPKRKGTKRSVEEGTISTNVKTITSSTHSETISSSSGPLVTYERQTYSEENGDGRIAIPSISLVNTKPYATKVVDFGDSQKTTHEFYASAMEDINQLIEEDPLLALEKLLTGKVSISSKPRKPVAQSETEVQSCSVGILLQELKTLMDSSSDPDHLVSREELKSKLISLFQRLNQHQDQGLLSSDIRDFVEKVQNFFNDHFVKHTTSQQVFNKHNQLLDSKTDLMNKLLSAKSTQTQIDNATSTANTQMHELSLQIDDLRKQLADLENQRDDLQLVVNNCDVQKKKLKAECTQWAQQSKELLSAIASSEIKVKEAERVRNLEKEGFANLKSSFPIF